MSKHIQARSQHFILWLLVLLTFFIAGLAIWLGTGPCHVGSSVTSVTDLILTLSLMLFTGLGGMIVFESYGTLFMSAFFETWLYRLSGVALFVGFPLVIGIAVFKYRLYDIDIIIKGTVVYGLLTVLLALIYFGSIIVLQRVFTMLTGHGSDLAIVISTLVIAVLFNPLRLRLQSGIDRRFFRQRYDAAQALQAFSAIARDKVNPEVLQREMSAIIQNTMRPATLAVWIKEHDRD